jgi:uncharacterized protein
MLSAVDPVGPTARVERILALDVLRGFALLGVFAVNASVSARPLEEAAATPDGPLAEELAWVLLSGVFVSKFVALFSLLFGMGLALQCRRLVAREGSDRRYLRRLAWLAVLGLLHGFLLFEGDILLLYAVAGALVYRVRRRSPAFLVRAALAVFLFGLALEAAYGSELLAADPAHAALVARAHAPEHATLALVLRVRALEYVGWLWLSAITLFDWQVVALFLLGAALVERGWLQAGRERLARVALAGLVTGTLLELAALVTRGARAQALLFAVGSVALALGYAGAVAWGVHAGRLPRLQRALAAVGRTALSSYVAQSVLLNVLFQPFALALWDELSRWTVLALVAALFALQVALAGLWLRRFELGPLEWLWRRLTYGAGVPGPARAS